MNKFLLTLIAVCSISGTAHASDGCVQVRSNNTYVVGARKNVTRGSINCFNKSIPMCREMKMDTSKPIPQPEKPRWNGNK